MLALVLGLAAASDHFDGSASTRHPGRDLTDLYSWTTEQDGESRLAMVLCVRPFSSKRARFDPDLTFRFTMRPSEIEGTGPETRVRTPAPSSTLDCHVDADGDTMVCRFESLGFPNRTRVVRAPIGQVEGAQEDGIRVFAGVRRDPFFIDTGKVSDLRPRSGVPPQKEGRDVTDLAILRGKVLAIAVELDPQTLLGGLGLVSISSEVGWASYEPDLPRLGGTP